MEMDNSQEPSKQETQFSSPQLPPPTDQTVVGQEPAEMSPEEKRILVYIGLGLLVLLIFTGLAIYYLGFVATLGEVTRIRDIFIIFLALQSLLTGLALVVLMVQVTRLVNLLQNEIKPILDSTNETVSTLRGTSAFLSSNLVEPVIKLNEYLAGFSQILYVMGLSRKSTKK
jgi:hypothetical protein